LGCVPRCLRRSAVAARAALGVTVAAAVAPAGGTGRDPYQRDAHADRVRHTVRFVGGIPQSARGHAHVDVDDVARHRHAAVSVVINSLGSGAPVLGPLRDDE